MKEPQEMCIGICETTLDIAHSMGRLFFNDGEQILPSKFFILLAVYRNGKSTVTQIAEQVGLSSSANTIAINKMAKEGLLDRVRDTVDKRICWIDLTGKGRTVLEEMIAKRNQLFQTILGDFPEEQLQVFLQSLLMIRDKFALGSTGMEEHHVAADRA
ncbi:MAG: MarR family winged helix-turn-helix transcriptional regulator [Paenibacillaceae bacterium]|uniref:MarR family winged helix-turn-helix transcriptional regulator n=1 Tax=Paenibacillus mellifer TaxID=2937794 RepID=A0A9X1Y2Q9_9BACL|nr:MarR family winged helix-turn-helix transcriptional regulator [Paenibacillus mellifer]MBW4838596.1 MarR family winged helix-turn-helix transcriptional regulator [Paenibacillaceae bacterium]MCK8489834.1 MarR family winged helix-turn-helix transcriptional regulator [Paenibacillus mellifer]